MSSQQQEFDFFFRDSMLSALNNLLGEGGMRAVVYNLDLQKANTIQSTHSKLASVFKVGTPVLERAIMKEVYRRLKLPYTESDHFDFVREFEEACSRFAVTGREERKTA